MNKEIDSAKVARQLRGAEILPQCDAKLAAAVIRLLLEVLELDYNEGPEGDRGSDPSATVVFKLL